MHDIKCKDVHIVSSMARNSNSDICENENELQPTSSQWTRITGRIELGDAEWTISGRIIITSETHFSRGDA